MNVSFNRGRHTRIRMQRDIPIATYLCHLLNTYVKVVFRMKTVNWSRLGGLGLSVDHERRLCEMQLVFYPLLSSIAFWTCIYWWCFIYC